MSYKMVVSWHSNVDGKTIGRPPLVVAFNKAENAMRELYLAIEKCDTYLVTGADFHMFIEMPDGEKLSLNDAYRKIFGINPVKHADGTSAYPLLFK